MPKSFSVSTSAMLKEIKQKRGIDAQSESEADAAPKAGDRDVRYFEYFNPERDAPYCHHLPQLDAAVRKRSAQDPSPAAAKKRSVWALQAPPPCPSAAPAAAAAVSAPPSRKQQRVPPHEESDSKEEEESDGEESDEEEDDEREMAGEQEDQRRAAASSNAPSKQTVSQRKAAAEALFKQVCRNGDFFILVPSPVMYKGMPQTQKDGIIPVSIWRGEVTETGVEQLWPYVKRNREIPFYGWFQRGNGTDRNEKSMLFSSIYRKRWRLKRDVVVTLTDGEADGLLFEPDSATSDQSPENRQLTPEGVISVTASLKVKAKEYDKSDVLRWAYRLLGSWLIEPPDEEDFGLWSIDHLRSLKEVYPSFHVSKWMQDEGFLHGEGTRRTDEEIEEIVAHFTDKSSISSNGAPQFVPVCI
uniref:Uncharacterized protein n=1 Tax=Chromera velia CCMP2878 TaxID=1169474 RepID=A0A0G4IBI5_9ALVE|eukprot:Cvel_2201.t1-p1 / transcript=Cvel_2201.t1 / gene=Cvel_2201 / organism=Chromera_velia_CCMP2878 / gene_product=hypothetical protein / transcript_product=hypothetical protein / location=Cvel_scaffold85:27122-28360(-) / protein_length=413 / sequence_SO=supercontig / SO=protein_coding / is_pseudo=false